MVDKRKSSAIELLGPGGILLGPLFYSPTNHIVIPAASSLVNQILDIPKHTTPAKLSPPTLTWSGGFAGPCGFPGALVTAFAVQRLNKRAGRPRPSKSGGASALVTAFAVQRLNKAVAAAASPPMRRLAFKPGGVRPTMSPLRTDVTQATA
ncbi:hypothetical protein ES703_37911 [subsurface metagenome]